VGAFVSSSPVPHRASRSSGAAAARADPPRACPCTQASTMQPQHVIAALKELEFTELAEEIEAHQREWEAAERPKGARPGFPPHARCARAAKDGKAMTACFTCSCTARGI